MHIIRQQEIVYIIENDGSIKGVRHMSFVGSSRVTNSARFGLGLNHTSVLHHQIYIQKFHRLSHTAGKQAISTYGAKGCKNEGINYYLYSFICPVQAAALG